MLPTNLWGSIYTYIYIYTRGFAPIGRLSMVIGPWYSRAPYVKEYEASGGRKRGNLSVHPLRGVFPPGSKDSRRWKHTFHWREDTAATCRLSMLLRAFLSLFSLEGRIGRGGSRLNGGQRWFSFFFSLGREERALKSLMDHGMIWFKNLKDGNFCKFLYSIFHDF